MNRALPKLDMPSRNTSQKPAAGGRRSTSLNTEKSPPRRSSAMWPAQWHRGGRAVTQPIDTATASPGRDRVPSLPAIPRFSLLPDFASDSFGEEKPLPFLPSIERGNHSNRDSAYQESISDRASLSEESLLIRRIRGQKVLLNVRRRDKLSPAAPTTTNAKASEQRTKAANTAANLQAYLTDARARANSTTENPRRLVPPPHEVRSASSPNVARVEGAPPPSEDSSRSQDGSPAHRIPRKPVPMKSWPATPQGSIRSRSTSPGCSIERAEEIERFVKTAVAESGLRTSFL